MQKTRIYVITQGDQDRLIKAPTVTTAKRYVATELEGRIASQEDLVRLLAEGIEIEDSSQPLPFEDEPAEETA